jgi:hypothetical protein
VLLECVKLLRFIFLVLRRSNTLRPKEGMRLLAQGPQLFAAWLRDIKYAGSFFVVDGFKDILLLAAARAAL